MHADTHKKQERRAKAKQTQHKKATKQSNKLDAMVNGIFIYVYKQNKQFKIKAKL